MRLFLIFCLGLAAINSSIFAGESVAHAASPVTISYPDFSSTTGLALSGAATMSGSALRLVPADTYQAGSAFDTTPLDTHLSFESQFVFSFHDVGETGLGPADGMTFTLQGTDSPAALGVAGGDLGYGSITPSIAVAFNMYYAGGKPPISVLSGGDAYTYPDSYKPSFNLYGTPLYVWIDYAGSSHVLSVYVSHDSTKPISPVLTYVYNIAAVIGSTVYAGFTAATGTGDMDQDILSWQLTQSQPNCTMGNINVWVDTVLDGCNWTHAVLPGAIFGGSSLRGASLRHAVLIGAVFGNADLTNADLSDIVASNANFVGGTLHGTHFQRALLRNASFTSGNLTGADFTDARLMNAVFQYAHVTNAVFTGARLDGANLMAATGLTAGALRGVHWYRTTCPDGTNSGTRGTCIGHLGGG